MPRLQSLSAWCAALVPSLPRWIGAAVAASLLAALIAGPSEASVAQRRSCEISDTATLGACFTKPELFDDFVFTADVICTTTSSCCPGGRAPIFFQGLQDKRILGNSHVLRREAGQHVCPVAVLRQVSGIVISDLTLDEDSRVASCELKERSCPSSIDIANSRKVHLTRVDVFDGKGYVVKVWSTNGFGFDQGAIVRAGIIGLYVGHYKYGPSRGVQITNSVFFLSRTNGVALQGAYSSDPRHPVLVSDNLFIDNHWHGLWPIPGGVTTGGQLFIGDGANLLVTGNIISGHRCSNCFHSSHVTGLEIGETQLAPAGVAGLIVENNRFIGTDESGFAVQQNPGSLVTNVRLIRNTVLGYDSLDNLHIYTLRQANVVGRPAWREAPQVGLEPSPQPGASVTVVLLCSARPGGPFFRTTRRNCSNQGQVVAVLGFLPHR